MISAGAAAERPMTSPLLLGVNLTGAEFGSNVPGTFGTDYTYPTHAEIDYYASKGLSVIRLPFLWERLQHSEFGAFDATELARLDDVVNYATGKGLKVDIDPHNYGKGFGALIGSAQTPNSADRKSTRLNSSHVEISYAVFCLKKKKINHASQPNR